MFYLTQNGIVDALNRYIVNVLEHSKLVKDPNDQELVKKIQSFVKKEGFAFDTISPDPEDEILTVPTLFRPWTFYWCSPTSRRSRS